MSAIEEAAKQAREAVHRALSLVDAFRPKILYKGNLADLVRGQGYITGGVRPLERLRKRLGGGLLGGRLYTPGGELPSTTETGAVEESSEANALILQKTKKGTTYLY